MIAESKFRSSMISEMRSWGAGKFATIRLDGGGSTQFKTNKHHFKSDDNRKLPHVITIRKY